MDHRRALEGVQSSCLFSIEHSIGAALPVLLGLCSLRAESQSVALTKTKPVPGGCYLSDGAVAYRQTVLEITVTVVAVKFRHDAHLSASRHLFGMQGLWKRLEGLGLVWYRIFRGENAYDCAMGLLFEAQPTGYNNGTMGVGSPRVIPKGKLCQP
ncbi:hypothetical protein EVAR_91360_1 [Eumeta japonica]|uniref:Uncharacterized protein n=1 Tax=Eumeta variegata TaxID=151549 RepID=A0A4C1TBR9_EUMVA|nr:hypothetical protein EVAR_91360_1 [Eumeta japonica]